MKKAIQLTDKCNKIVDGVYNTLTKFERHQIEKGEAVDDILDLMKDYASFVVNQVVE